MQQLRSDIINQTTVFIAVATSELKKRRIYRKREPSNITLFDISFLDYIKYNYLDIHKQVNWFSKQNCNVVICMHVSRYDFNLVSNVKLITSYMIGQQQVFYWHRQFAFYEGSVFTIRNVFMLTSMVSGKTRYRKRNMAIHHPTKILVETNT